MIKSPLPAPVQKDSAWFSLKALLLPKNTCPETPASRWNYTKKKHLPSKEPTEGMTWKWPEALESSISLLSVTSDFLKMNH